MACFQQLGLQGITIDPEIRVNTNLIKLKKKKNFRGQVRWLTPVILAALEAEIRRTAT
jgi:hypothetical protein